MDACMFTNTCCPIGTFMTDSPPQLHWKDVFWQCLACLGYLLSTSLEQAHSCERWERSHHRLLDHSTPAHSSHMTHSSCRAKRKKKQQQNTWIQYINQNAKSRKDAAIARHPQSEGLIKPATEGWTRGSGVQKPSELLPLFMFQALLTLWQSRDCVRAERLSLTVQPSVIKDRCHLVLMSWAPINVWAETGGAV